MATDWFRNSAWNPEIARSFEEKLNRARKSNRAQYLRIQACTLAPLLPKVALDLLDRYFELPREIGRAQAYVDRATALFALSQPVEAARAYLDALTTEAEFPGVKTQAYLQFPFLVATNPLPKFFATALETLNQHADRPVFPVEVFRWHAARSLIMHAQGDSEAARRHAVHALGAADLQDSGMRYHSRLGLVQADEMDTIRQLESLANA